MSVLSWQSSRLSLFSRVLGAQLIGLGVALALSLALETVVPTTPGYLAKMSLVFVVTAGVVIANVGAHHPFESFGPANHVTTVRAAVVAVTAGLIGEQPTVAVAWGAATLGMLATVLDGVDGWLARRTSMSSAFGARYDMELDALLILVLALIAWQNGKAGPWIVLAGAMRYLFVAAGYWWRWLESPLPPSTRRKAVCVAQIVGLGIVVSPFVGGGASAAIAASTLALLTWSFGIDVLWLRTRGH